MVDRAVRETLVDKALAFARTLWRRFNENHCLEVAASLSYTSLISIVPLVAIGFAVMAAFPVFEAVQSELEEFIYNNFLPSAVTSVKEYITQFVGNARGLTTIGIVGLAVTSLLLFITIESAINLIFEVSRPRSLVARLLVFWAILTLGPLLIGASFSIATYAVAYAQRVGGEALSGPFGMMTRSAPAVLMITAFTICYWVIPNRPVRFVHALAGGIVAGLMFSLLRRLFTLWVTSFPAYQTLYGALATIPIFLFWMYLSWTVVLAGAVLTAELPHWNQPPRRGQLPERPGDRLTVALALLSVLYGSGETGRGIKRRTLLQTVDAADSVVDGMLEVLREARFAAPTDTGRWLPTRDPVATTLYDLIRALGLDLAVDPSAERTDQPEWRLRLSDLIRADGERQRAFMEVDLRGLLIGHNAADPAVDEASPLPLRRTP